MFFYANLCKQIRVQQLKNLISSLDIIFWVVSVAEFYFSSLEDTTMPELAIGQHLSGWCIF